MAADGKVLLVVDDEADILGLIQDWLEARGFILLTASSAEEAIKVLAAVETGELAPITQIDLLLTDIHMERKTGIELAAETSRRWPSVKYAFMTGYRQSPEVLASTPTLMKPFTGRMLFEFVKFMLTGDIADYAKWVTSHRRDTLAV